MPTFCEVKLKYMVDTEDGQICKYVHLHGISKEYFQDLNGNCNRCGHHCLDGLGDGISYLHELHINLRVKSGVLTFMLKSKMCEPQQFENLG